MPGDFFGGHHCGSIVFGDDGWQASATVLLAYLDEALLRNALFGVAGSSVLGRHLVLTVIAHRIQLRTGPDRRQLLTPAIDSCRRLAAPTPPCNLVVHAKQHIYLLLHLPLVIHIIRTIKRTLRRVRHPTHLRIHMGRLSRQRELSLRFWPVLADSRLIQLVHILILACY